MRHRWADGFTLIELVAVIVVLAIISVVAVPKYFDHSSAAKASADAGAIAGINSALNGSFLSHRAQGASSGSWITASSQVAGVMEGGSLPGNITYSGVTFTDGRGNTYTFTAETATTAAKLTPDSGSSGGTGGSGGSGGGGSGGSGGSGWGGWS